MSEIQSCFKRYEKKYMLTPEQYRAMIRGMAFHMRPDAHPRYTIGNVYYDTADYALIRKSLEKPIYKEKLRVRSYGVPGDDDPAFVEIKKKFDGVVYKRRVTMTAAQAADWLRCGTPPMETNRPADSDFVRSQPREAVSCSADSAVMRSQISREIDWFLNFYHPMPAVYIAYDREAYAGIDNSELRITFDRALRWRDTHVDLRDGGDCRPIDVGGNILMEIKIPGAAPLWLARLLSENHIVSTSFSKYGAYYKQAVLTPYRNNDNHKEARYIA